MTRLQILKRTVTVLLLVVVVGIIAAFLILRSERFHDYVLARIVQKIEEATGGRVEIENYSFNWASLRASVTNLTIHGTESAAEHPLFSADRVIVGLKIVSALRREVDLKDLIVDRPAVNLKVDKNGNTNLPRPRIPKKDQQQVDVFDLAVKNFAIHDGEFFYNDRKHAIGADLQNLRADITYDLLRESYNGEIRYQNGDVSFGGGKPIIHNLETTFSATREGVELKHLDLVSGSSRAALQGFVRNYADPTLDATYSVALTIEEQAAILKNDSLPRGQFRSAGSIRFHNPNDRPFLEAIEAQGNIGSNNLTLRSGRYSAEVRNVQGKFRLENGKLVSNDLSAIALGGHLTMMADIDLRNSIPSKVRSNFEGVSLSAIARALPGAGLDKAPMDGTVKGSLEASWLTSVQTLQARSEMTVEGKTQAPGSGSASAPVPVNAVIRASYNGARKTLSLDQSYLRTPQSEVIVSGTASDRSSIQIRATTQNLGEVDRIAQFFRTDRAQGLRAVTPPLLGLEGSGNVVGELQGSTDNLRFSGLVDLADVKYQTARLQSVRGNVELSSSALQMRNGYLKADRGQVQFDLEAGLSDWKYSESQPVKVRATTESFPVGTLRQLVNLDYPIEGTLTARVDLEGTQAQPSGRGSAVINHAVAWDEIVDRLTVNFEGAGNALRATVALRAPAGQLNGTATYFASTKEFEATIDSAQVQIQDLHAVQSRNPNVTGTLSISGSGRGSVANPQIALTVSAPEVSIREQKLDNLRAELAVANQRADITVHSRMLDSDIQGVAKIDLTGDYSAEARVDTGSVPVELVLATYLPNLPKEIAGQTEIHAVLTGPLKDQKRIDAQIDVPKLNIAYRDFNIQNATPLRAEFRDGVVTVRRTRLTGTGTDIIIEGTTPVSGGGAMKLAANGEVDLKILRLVNSELDSSGKAKLDVRAEGEFSNPAIQGQVQIVDAAVAGEKLPLGIDHVNGELALRNNRIDIVRLAGASGGGTISATGSISRQNTTQFDIQLGTNGVRLRYPKGMRAVLGGQISFDGTPDASHVRGQVSIQRLSFTDQFDLAEFVNQFRGEATVRSPETFTGNVALDVAVNSAETLQLESAKASIQGTSNLRLRGTLANPVILGRTTLSGGELFFLGNRYEIQNGIIDFSNPIRTEPTVKLAVSTRVDQYDLNLTFVGPVDRLRTTYTSSPPLPPVDIINLLAFGTTSETSGTRNPSVGAQSLLAQGLSSQVSSRLERLVGISRLSIDPGIGANQSNPGARVVIQQRASRKLLFTFGIDLTSTQSDVIQVEYEVTKGWTLSTLRDNNGRYAIDVKRRKTF